MVRGNEWRDLRAVLWEQAWRQRDVASAFSFAQRIRTTRRSAEAAAVEDVAYELHDAEFRRVCAANGIEATEAGRARAKRRRG